MVNELHQHYLQVEHNGETHEAYAEYETWEDKSLPYMTRLISLSLIQVVCDVELPAEAVLASINQLIQSDDRHMSA